MGLLVNAFIGIAHLVLVATDIVVMMILLDVIYRRWQPAILRPAVIAIRPVLECVLRYFEICTVKISGQRYPQKTSMILLIISMTFLRLIVGGLL